VNLLALEERARKNNLTDLDGNYGSAETFGVGGINFTMKGNKKMWKKIKNRYSSLGQSTYLKTALSPESCQFGLFVLGVVLLSTGITMDASAYSSKANYNDHRIAESADIILTFLNGSFGALVMVASGIGAIISGAFGQYRASLGLMVVAVGSFIVRSLISTWFNDSQIYSD